MFDDCKLSGTSYSSYNKLPILEHCTSGKLVPIYFNYTDSKFHLIDYTHLSSKNMMMDYTFDAILDYSGYSKGRSSVDMFYENNLFIGNMKLSHFDALIRNPNLINIKKVNATWGITKQGSNVGLKVIKLL